MACDMEKVIMGILNCTPDSFYEGSRKQTADDIAARADEIVSEGGSIIDVGAFSTRPGATEVSEEEEMRRLRTALEVIRHGHEGVTVSVDTFRPAVARMAVEEYGVQIINDVSEGGMGSIADAGTCVLSEGEIPLMFQEVARLKVGYVLMSVQPDMEKIIGNFRKEVSMLRSLGVSDIILDPGFGFGKTSIEGNYKVLSELGRLREEYPELPLMAALSRKRMIWQLLGCSAQEEDALRGTMLANLMALERGATILRVHDVKAAADTIKICSSLSA